MKTILKNIAVAVSAIAATLAICLVIMAWSEPSATPPEGNVAAPINTGSTQQTKAGPLGIKLNDLGYWISQVGQSLAFFNSESSGNPKEAKMVIGQDGNVGIGTAVPDKKLVVGGAAQANQFCLNGKCCSTWEECAGSGNILADISCEDSLPVGNKRIFATSELYYVPISGQSIYTQDFEDGNFYLDLAKMDSRCQALALLVGWTGNFKALVMYGGRNPRDVLSNSDKYWNIVQLGYGTSRCYAMLVAENEDDFFTPDGQNNYLKNPIAFSQNGGLALSFGPVGDSGFVFTNFNANGFRGVCYTPGAMGKDNEVNCPSRISWQSIGDVGMGSLGAKDYSWSSGRANLAAFHIYCVEQ